MVVFPVLHGTFGEDGTVQGLLELADVAYVGAGVLGSAIGMDKDVAKRLLRDAGIPVVDFARRHGRGVRARSRRRRWPALPGLGYPLFVKPANAGSSVGVSRVNGPAGLAPAVRAALAFDRKVLLERAVDAREIECAVLGNDDPVASVPGEIVVHHKDGFYSYDAKYVDADGASWKIPADLAAATAARVQDAGRRDVPDARAGRAWPASTSSSRATTGALYVNEVNTIPGFTAISMYPKMWEASGLSQQALLTASDRARARTAGRAPPLATSLSHREGARRLAPAHENHLRRMALNFPCIRRQRARSYIAGVDQRKCDAAKRGVGRPSKAQPFRAFVVDLLLKQPNLRSLEIVRRAPRRPVTTAARARSIR